MPRISRQTIAPYPFTTETLAESNWREVQIRMSNALNVLRYLTSKIVYTDREISQVEIVTLFAAFEKVIQQIEIDRNFRQKCASDVFTFRSIYQSLDSLIKVDPKERHRKLQEKYAFYRGKIFSRRYYFAVEGQARRLYDTFIKHRFPKTFPPKTFVGKGYGDHGTAKNKAFDASPAWQEVAGDQEFQEKNPSTSRDPDYFLQFKVHPLQLEGGLFTKDKILVEDRGTTAGS